MSSNMQSIRTSRLPIGDRAHIDAEIYNGFQCKRYVEFINPRRKREADEWYRRQQELEAI